MATDAYPSAQHYAIIGAGAIGGYYGACLQRGGLGVHFLLHSDYSQVLQHGLKVDSINGDFALPQVQAYQQASEMPQVDVVVIALKTTQNARLLPSLLPPLLKPETVILTLQNGLDIEADIAAIAPNHPIFGGLCFICSNKVGPGHIHHIDYGSVLLGSYSSEQLPVDISPSLAAIAQDFTQAGIKVDVTDDLYLARWRKLVWNIPFNSLSVILNATTEAMMAHSNTRQLAADLMAEVVAAAHACVQDAARGDRALPADIIETMLAHTATMKPYRTSMKIDFDEGRPLEVEAIVGNPLRAAQAVGVETPRIEMLYHQLKAIDARDL
ncbi:putative 2-dehydropantoate 2-reductase [Oscillatoria sp. CS-180]|uniref:putative 2-dehydropantoate 2-reductase n=1 Tax=Oscillatoria sp. CS-180 TaxID=3021720 RepID=UPI0023305EDF|nr:putative 2-dehydropantoate 2-reductase [Oscillatoria sp. CS-180]MDB9529081.1 putative 2-dehydropantoate 2-reductase [Oscillatoria sp. CS-180]